MTQPLRQFAVGTGLWGEPPSYSGHGGYTYSPHLEGGGDGNTTDNVLNNRIPLEHRELFTEEELQKLVEILSTNGDIQGAERYQELLEDLQRGKVIARRRYRQLRAMLEKQAVAKRYFFDFYLVDELVGAYSQWISEDVHWYREELVTDIADSYIQNLEQMVWKEAQYLWVHDSLWHVLTGSGSGFHQASLLSDEQIINHGIWRERHKLEHHRDVERKRYQRKGIPIPPELQADPPPGPYEEKHTIKQKKEEVDALDPDDAMEQLQQLLQEDPEKAKELLQQLKSSQGFTPPSGKGSLTSLSTLRGFSRYAQVYNDSPGAFNYSALKDAVQDILEQYLTGTLSFNDEINVDTRALEDQDAPARAAALLLARVHEVLNSDQFATLEALQTEEVARIAFFVSFDLLAENNVGNVLFTFDRFYKIFVMELQEEAEEVTGSGLGLELGLPYLTNEEAEAVQNRLDQAAIALANKTYAHMEGYNFHGWCAEALLILQPTAKVLGFDGVAQLPLQTVEYVVKAVDADFSACIHGPKNKQEATRMLMQWVRIHPEHFDEEQYVAPVLQRYLAIVEDANDLQSYLLQVIDTELDIQTLPSLYTDLTAIEAIPRVWCQAQDVPDDMIDTVTSAVLSTFFSLLDNMYVSLNMPVGSVIQEEIQGSPALVDLHDTLETRATGQYSSVLAWLEDCAEIVDKYCVLDVEDLYTIHEAEVVLLDLMPEDLRGTFNLFSFTTVLHDAVCEYLEEKALGATDRRRIEDRLRRERKSAVKYQSFEISDEDPYVFMSKYQQREQTLTNQPDPPGGPERIKEVLALLDIDPDRGLEVIEALKYPYATVRQHTDLEDNHLPVRFYSIITQLYDKLHWPSAYGGPAWGMISDGLVRLLEAYPDVDKLTQAIDHIHDLQHNTGSVFTKFKYVTLVDTDEDGNPLPEDAPLRKIVHSSNEAEWIQEALDLKFGKHGTRDMLPRCSPKVAKWTRKAYMDAGRSELLNPPSQEEKVDDLSDRVTSLYRAGNSKAIHAEIRQSSDPLFYHALASYEPGDKDEARLVADTRNYLVKYFFWGQLQGTLSDETKVLLGLRQFYIALPTATTKQFVGSLWNQLNTGQKRKAFAFVRQNFSDHYSNFRSYIKHMAQLTDAPEADDQNWLYNGCAFAAYITVDDGVEDIVAPPGSTESSDSKQAAQMLAEVEEDKLEKLGIQTQTLKHQTEESIETTAAHAADPEKVEQEGTPITNTEEWLLQLQSIEANYKLIMNASPDVATKAINRAIMAANSDTLWDISDRDEFDLVVGTGFSDLRQYIQWNSAMLQPKNPLVPLVMNETWFKKTYIGPGVEPLMQKAVLDLISICDRELQRQVVDIDSGPSVEDDPDGVSTPDFETQSYTVFNKVSEILSIGAFLSSHPDQNFVEQVFEAASEEIAKYPSVVKLMGGSNSGADVKEAVEGLTIWHADLMEVKGPDWLCEDDEEFLTELLAVNKIDVNEEPEYAHDNMALAISVIQEALQDSIESIASTMLPGGATPSPVNSGTALRNILRWYSLMEAKGSPAYPKWLSDVYMLLLDGGYIEKQDSPVSAMASFFDSALSTYKVYAQGVEKIDSAELMDELCQQFPIQTFWTEVLSSKFIQQMDEEVENDQGGIAEPQILGGFFIHVAESMGLALSQEMPDGDFEDSVLMQQVALVSKNIDMAESLYADMSVAWDKVPDTNKAACASIVLGDLIEEGLFDAGVMTEKELAQILDKICGYQDVANAYDDAALTMPTFVALMLKTFHRASAIDKQSTPEEEKKEKAQEQKIEDYFANSELFTNEDQWWMIESVAAFWKHPKTTMQHRYELLTPALRAAQRAGVINPDFIAKDTQLMPIIKKYLKDPSAGVSTLIASPILYDKTPYGAIEVLRAIIFDMYNNVPAAFKPGSSKEDQEAFFQKKKPQETDLGPLDEVMEPIAKEHEKKQSDEETPFPMKFKGPKKSKPAPKKKKPNKKNPPPGWGTSKPKNDDDYDIIIEDTSSLRGIRRFSVNYAT